MSTAFLKGLKEQESMWTRATLDNKNITMLRCIRFVMKNYGISLEIKRQTRASTLIRLCLVKYNKDGYPVDLGIDLSVTDSRIERGLFELETKTMQCAGLKPMKGLDSILEMLRRCKLNLPPHDTLRNEIVMKANTIRISYAGADKNSEDDLFVGVLLSNDEVVVRTAPHKRMGPILDSLENALHSKECEKYRAAIGEIIIKLCAEDYDSGL